jgi:hypothetical protein
MPDDHHVALRLDVDAEADPIRGVLTTEHGAPRAFEGWLGLAAEIERTLREIPPGSEEVR